MRIRLLSRTFFVVAALFVVAPAASAPAAAQTPRALIETLGDKAIKSLTGSVPRPEREQRFQGLLREGFDVEAIGRFTLGRYWRQATPEQQAEYLKLFERFIVQAYAARFAEYNNEQFRVTGERPDGDVVIIQSEIFKPGAQPTRVEWRVSTGNPKIIDVVVEGVSMAVTQRSEFAAVIQRNGGNVDGLLTALRSKTNG